MPKADKFATNQSLPFGVKSESVYRYTVRLNCISIDATGGR